MPEESAVVVPTTVASMVTVTVLFASAVPEIGGLLVVTVEPFAGAETTGAPGAVVSTVKVFAVDAAEVLLAASRAVAATVCDPSLNGVGPVKDQFPEPSATVVPIDELSTMTETVLPASAVPE